jgi:molecular chaperone GrpE
MARQPRRPQTTKGGLQVDHDDLGSGPGPPAASTGEWPELAGSEDETSDLDAMFAELRSGYTPSPDRSRSTRTPASPRPVGLPRDEVCTSSRGPAPPVPAAVRSPPGRLRPETPFEPPAADARTARERRREDLRDRLNVRVDSARQKGHADVIARLVPLFDAIDQALASLPPSAANPALVRAVSLALDQFEADLRPLGLERVPALGLPFDPGCHEALRQVRTGRVASGVVAREVRRGYRLLGKLLRTPLVEIEV